jgi:hypothetical protein
MKKSVTLFLVLILLVSCLASCNFLKHDFLDTNADNVCDVCGHTQKTQETTQETTEHTHQWQDVSGEHARICVGCNEKQLASEACDWQFIGQTSDCWSTTITYGCSKCYQQQVVHGDSVLPNHNWIEETANGKTALHCSRCKESCTFVSGLQEFSYAQVLEEYKIGEPNVKYENFNNPEVEREITGAIDAITRAKFELIIEYDTISVSHDKDSNMWCVDFWTLDVVGGGQSVYLNGNGLTCYIVYGE